MDNLGIPLLVGLVGLYGKIIFDLAMRRRNNNNPNGVGALFTRVEALEKEILGIRLRLHENANHIATLLERTRKE